VPKDWFDEKENEELRKRKYFMSLACAQQHIGHSVDYAGDKRWEDYTRESFDEAYPGNAWFEAMRGSKSMEDGVMIRDDAMNSMARIIKCAEINAKIEIEYYKELRKRERRMKMKGVRVRRNGKKSVGEVKTDSHVNAIMNCVRDKPKKGDMWGKFKRMKTPASVDLRPKCPAVYVPTQGNLNSCTAQAIAAAYEFDEEDSENKFTPSRLFIYYNERVIEGTTKSDPGARIRDGIETIRSTGVCREESWNYDITKATTKPPAHCYIEAEDHKAITYHRVKQDLRSIKSCLAQGKPIVFGFAVFPSYSSSTSKTGLLKMPNGETRIGGHCVLAVGYSDKHKTITVRNSYGPNWGAKGHFYVPYKFILNKDLAWDFWVVNKVRDRKTVSQMKQHVHPELVVTWPKPESQLSYTKLIPGSLKGKPQTTATRNRKGKGKKMLMKSEVMPVSKQSDETIASTSRKLPHRLDDSTFEEVIKIFGAEYSNGTGPLKRDSEWDVLCQLGKEHFGEGRWLPKLSYGSGECAGVQWALQAVIPRSGSMFGPEDLKNAQFLIEYPLGQRTEVKVSRLLESFRAADYKKLSYYVRRKGVKQEGLKAVVGNISHSMVEWATKCNSMYSYLITRNVVYTMDSSTDLLPLAARGPNSTVTAIYRQFSGGDQVQVAIVPVPKKLVDKLSIRATGRKRDAALLRDLMRHAIILVESSDEVSTSSKGITAAKLAFVAMTWNSKFESELCKTLRPGVLSLNDSIAKAFSPRERWGVYSMTSLAKRAMKFALFTYLAANTSNALALAVGTSTELWDFTRASIMLDGSDSLGVSGKVILNFVKVLTALLIRGGLDISRIGRFVASVFETGPEPSGSSGVDYRHALIIYLMRRCARVTVATGLLATAMSGVAFAAQNVGEMLAGSIISQDVYNNLGPYFSKPAEFLGVAAEELLKRAHPLATIAIVGAETLRDRTAWYLPTAAMHYVTSKCSLPVGILLHFAWNFAAQRQYESMLDSVPEDINLSCLVDQEYDECVDALGPKNDDIVHEKNKLTLPGNYGLNSRMPCCERKPSIYYSALSVDSVIVRKFSSCVCNERRAILSRVATVSTGTNAQWAKSWSISRSMPNVVCPDQSKWESKLPSLSKGLVQRHPSNYVIDRKALVIKAFVKVEKHVAIVGTHIVKPNRVPRLIQGRSLAVKVATGPFTHSYGKTMMSCYGVDSDYVYTSGMSSEDIGLLFTTIPQRVVRESNAFSNNLKEPCWHAIDCKRFDRSVGPSPLLLLYQEYKRCGAPKDCLLAYKNRHKRQFGATRNGIRYARTAQVNSGDGDTSAGNSRMHLVMLEACPHVYGCLVHGDDAVILTNDIESVMAWYVLHDFVPVLAPDIDFCSSLFWPTADGIVLGPKVGRVLAKSFQSMRKFHEYEPWIRGVMLSTRFSWSFIPILRAINERFLHLLGDGKVQRDCDHVYKSRAVGEHECCTDTFAFFEERYSLSENEVLALEESIRNSLNIGDVLKDPAYLQIVKRDVLG